MPTTCPVCTRVFSNPSALSKHLEVHSHEKPHTCHICGKSFGRKGVLKRHLVTHSNQKPYHCELCGKGFTQKGSVVKHMVVHTGEKPFQCHKCLKHFTEKSNLLKHLRIVHKDKETYRCSKCEMSFAFKAELTTHMTDAHVQNHGIASSTFPMETSTASSQSSAEKSDVRRVTNPKITTTGIPLTYPSVSLGSEQMTAVRRALESVVRGKSCSAYLTWPNRRPRPLVLYKGEDTTEDHR